MALLSISDRQAVCNDTQRELSVERDTISTLTKADLLAAVNAVDQWVSDNQASYNSALPLTARNSLSVAQKARLLANVVTKRFKLGVN